MNFCLCFLEIVLTFLTLSVVFFIYVLVLYMLKSHSKDHRHMIRIQIGNNSPRLNLLYLKSVFINFSVLCRNDQHLAWTRAAVPGSRSPHSLNGKSDSKCSK